MNCCEKCIGVSPIRGVVCNNKLCPCHFPKECCSKCIYYDHNVDITQCNNPNCPCHSKDDGLEKVLSEFDKKYLTGELFIEDTVVDGVPLEPIKKFITQVYKEAYEKGEQNGIDIGEKVQIEWYEKVYVPKAKEEERQRIKKIIDNEKLEYLPEPHGTEANIRRGCWNDGLDKVKKII